MRGVREPPAIMSVRHSAEQETGERRASLRERLDVQMFFSVLRPEELESAAAVVLSQVNALGIPESVAETFPLGRDEEGALHHELCMIRRLLEKMTSQMDNLTNLLANKDQTEGSSATQALEVFDCSADGLSILHDSHLDAGTALKMRLVFRSTSATIVECLGSVRRCVPSDRPGLAQTSNGLEGDDKREFNIGIIFTHIHESDRERIIRHIFEVQRNQLRDRRISKEQ